MKPKVFIAVFIFLLCLGWIFAAADRASGASPTPTPKPEPGMKFPGLLTPPPTVAAPSQADRGAQTYFYICLVCHGQSGEGLDAWRKQLEPPDNNCWQSKCHSPNKMDFGFTFPREVPALHNRGMLLTFQNANRLAVFIKTYMPFQNPNSLSDEQTLELTAYLMRMNGLEPGSTPLTMESAKTVSLLPPTATPTQTALALVKPSLDPILVGTAALMFLAAAALGGYFVRSRRRQ